MLLTIRFPGAGPEEVGSLLQGETEQHVELPYGEGLAWTDDAEGSPALRLSLLVRTASVVARTKRRDKEERFSVGYCDSYPFTASGLMALFLARLSLRDSLRRELQIELVAYPYRPHAEQIARRIFVPAGYSVCAADGRLKLEGKGSLDELPALLLALDRNTRLFLAPDELEEIGLGAKSLLSDHPARRAIELAVLGRPTPLRLLLSPGEIGAMERDERAASWSETVPIESPVSVSSNQAEYARAVLSRINIDPRWLMYLPSGIASVQSAKWSELERPEGALEYFRDERIEKAIVEEKHMGSRGIVVLCRTAKTAKERFGIECEVPGCAYTRNGRKFFNDDDTGAVFLERVEAVLSRANFWDRFSTDWVCFDGEILPWAVKAASSSEESDLVETGSAALQQTVEALSSCETTTTRDYWRGMVESEFQALREYDAMFKHYRTESANLAALKFAPFHVLAVEGQTFFHRSHEWHMQTVSRLARSGDGFLIPTRYEILRPADTATWSRTLGWWEELSESSSEGFVIKPFPFVPRGRRGAAQPALKCRSQEHLRLVYGPRYDSPEAREVLLARDALHRRRNKHRRILRQFSLSMEAVTRFVQRSPMEAVHACLLGVLAQEVAPAMST